MMYYIVNIYSDFIRQKRKITNLNESAYNKVISNTKLISEKKNIKIISLGFGKQKNGNFFYREINEKNENIVINYLINLNIYIIKYIFASLSLSIKLLKDRKNIDDVIFYNPSLIYLPTIIMCKIFKIRIILDFEDGLSSKLLIAKYFYNFKVLLLSFFIDKFILINDNLKKYVFFNKEYLVYYGNFDIQTVILNNYKNDKINVLFSGNLSNYTGAKFFTKFLIKLKREEPKLFNSFNFYITGDGIDKEFIIYKLKKIAKNVHLKFSLNKLDYINLLRKIDVGLNLRNSKFVTESETFPNKIFEYTNYNIPTISTESRNIKKLFKNNEIIFLKELNYINLKDILLTIIENPQIIHKVKKNIISKDFIGRNENNKENFLSFLLK